MIEVHVTRNFDLNADAVWGLLADFGNMSWAPGIEKIELIGEGIGMIRRLYMPDMAPIDEQLVERDHDNRTYAYTIPRGLPMPMTDYSARVVVSELEEGHCSVHFRGRATPEGLDQEEATAILRGTYEMLLQWVDDHLNQPLQTTP